MIRYDKLFERCLLLTQKGTAFVLVTLGETTGSTPQDQGAKMIVTRDGLDLGTVGGGRIEAKAIDVARAMLREGPDCQWLDWNLKADVGMTCGGRVKLFFERYSSTAWPIVIFGAGHVAQALCRLLVTMPCQTTCVDPRADWLERLPQEVAGIHAENPADHVAQLADGSFVLCMTQGHRSDFPVLREIFQSERSFPFLGVIGSRAKAAVLRKELDAAAIPAERIQFHCPVGLPIGSNHPGEIAVSIAAQLLQVRDEDQLGTSGC